MNRYSTIILGVIAATVTFQSHYASNPPHRLSDTSSIKASKEGAEAYLRLEIASSLQTIPEKLKGQIANPSCTLSDAMLYAQLWVEMPTEGWKIDTLKMIRSELIFYRNKKKRPLNKAIVKQITQKVVNKVNSNIFDKLLKAAHISSPESSSKAKK